MTGSILVTGRSGFIGGRLAERLDRLGWSVAGIGRRQLSLPDYYVQDLGDGLPAGMPGRFDVVVHAAARSSPWGTRRQYYRDNVLATRNVVDYCRHNGRPKLIYISSSSVYYRPQHQFDLTEESPLPRRAVNLYAETKREGEALVRQYEGPWVILRPRAVYGPGDTVLLPRIVEAARRRRLPLLVAPGDPVVGDLIYIENLLDYIVKSASTPGLVGDYNLTNNQPVEIHAFLRSVLERLDVPPPTRRLSVRTAMLGAATLELAHRLFLPHREPAITRFGVHVFAYSKTFDVRKCIAAMGAPRITNERGVDELIEWMTRPEA